MDAMFLGLRECGGAPRTEIERVYTLYTRQIDASRCFADTVIVETLVLALFRAGMYHRINMPLSKIVVSSKI